MICDMRYVIYDIWYVICDMWYVICDIYIYIYIYTRVIDHHLISARVLMHRGQLVGTLTDFHLKRSESNSSVVHLDLSNDGRCLTRPRGCLIPQKRSSCKIYFADVYVGASARPLKKLKRRHREQNKPIEIPGDKSLFP